jgi:hypothetical protein
MCEPSHGMSGTSHAIHSRSPSGDQAGSMTKSFPLSSMRVDARVATSTTCTSARSMTYATLLPSTETAGAAAT